MDINRVIEIDADTSREELGVPWLSIRYASQIQRSRTRQPNWEPDLEQDLHIFTHVLALTILQMEEQGIAKKGEAISFAINNLQAIYVDANILLQRSKLGIENNSSSFGRKIDGF